jgi:S-layer homology domain/Copper amine oxidase N-terminal domain
MKIKKLIVSGALSASLVVTSIPNILNIPVLENEMRVEAATLKFKDVDTKSFAYDAIYELVSREIVYGHKDGTFKPGDTVTRGQFATMLARALKLPKADSKFKDLPKTKSLYDGVSRAAKVGIIKGNNGYVNADKPVSRADIAVMIDRAMNLKGTYNDTVSLNFEDANSIPAYAVESVKKMTRYGIIQGKGNNTFAPGEFADRATSSVFIYRMLNVLEGKTPVPPVQKDYRDMTVDEIKAIVGEYTIVERITAWDSTKSIRVRDFVQEYYDRLHNPIYGKYIAPPQEYFKDWVKKFQSDYLGFYNSYPKYEVISFNGVAYRNSPLFPGTFSFDFYDQVVPSQPQQDGKFLIDIHTYSKDFVTYTKQNVKVHNLVQVPVSEENDYIVNLKETFKYAIGVSVENNGLTLTYNGNRVEMTNGSSEVKVNGVTNTLPSKVEVKNGAAYGPIRAIAEHLGLESREMLPSKLRLEIANYPLEKVEGIWD